MTDAQITEYVQAAVGCQATLARRRRLTLQREGLSWSGEVHEFTLAAHPWPGVTTAFFWLDTAPDGTRHPRCVVGGQEPIATAEQAVLHELFPSRAPNPGSP